VRRAVLTGTIVAAIIVSASGGFWLGLREGWELALMADSARIGSVAVPRLAAIRLGHVDALTTGLELDVDNGLLWSHHFLESSLHPYLTGFWGLNGYPENRQEMARLAGYRRTHPSPSLVDDGDVRSRAAYADSSDGIMDERRRIIGDVVQRFAAQP